MSNEYNPGFQRVLSGDAFAAPSIESARAMVTSIGERDALWFQETFSRIAENVGRVLKGKTDQINLALIALVSEGHLLLEDVPGVGKTSLARAIAESISGSWQRVQFTPDLLPTDVTGISIWNQARGEFEFKQGPVFANIVIGDEINRASPKTQSALLEVMEERQVTVDGRPRKVPRPFVVVATQNPVEMDGTYNLPEAQLDRFLLKMSMGYPDMQSEMGMVVGRVGVTTVTVDPVVSTEDVTRLIDVSSAVRLDPELVHFAVSVVQATRQTSDIRLGASPRGSLGLLRAAQSLAIAEGRTFAVADDVKRLALPVLGHRLILSPDAQLRGLTPERIIGELLTRVTVPGGIGR